MLPLRMLALAIAVVVPDVAMAQSAPRPPAHPGPMAACLKDIKTLCGGVQPGGGRIRDCMREHRAQLSDACKIAIADRMLERGGPRPNGPGPGGNPRASDNGPAGGPGVVRIVR